MTWEKGIEYLQWKWDETELSLYFEGTGILGGICYCVVYLN